MDCDPIRKFTAPLFIIHSKEAIMLMDNCSLHTLRGALSLFGEHHGKLIGFSHHTTHLFQNLDLTRFSIIKRKLASNLPFRDDERPA
jgi:hypothetical protein